MLGCASVLEHTFSEHVIVCGSKKATFLKEELPLISTTAHEQISAMVPNFPNFWKVGNPVRFCRERLMAVKQLPGFHCCQEFMDFKTLTRGSLLVGDCLPRASQTSECLKIVIMTYFRFTVHKPEVDWVCQF